MSRAMALANQVIGRNMFELRNYEQVLRGNLRWTFFTGLLKIALQSIMLIIKLNLAFYSTKPSIEPSCILAYASSVMTHLETVCEYIQSTHLAC